MKPLIITLALLLPSLASAQVHNVRQGVQFRPQTVKPTLSSGYGGVWLKTSDDKLYFTNAAGTSTALSTLALSDLGGLTLSAYRIYKTGSAANYINWDIADTVQLKTASADLKVSTAVYMGGNVLNASDVTYDIGTPAYRFKLAYVRALAVGDTGANQPTCNSDNRGMIFMIRAASTDPDELEVCMKKADDSYAWIPLLTAP